MATRKRKIKKRKLYEKRTFLNPRSEGGLAAIDASVELTESDTEIHVSSSLGFSDCSNQIYLDFDVWDSSAMIAALVRRRKKVAHLREIINGFLDATEAAYDEIEKKLPAKEAAIKARAKANKDKKKK